MNFVEKGDGFQLVCTVSGLKPSYWMGCGIYRSVGYSVSVCGLSEIKVYEMKTGRAVVLAKKPINCYNGEGHASLYCK